MSTELVNLDKFLYKRRGKWENQGKSMK